MFLQRNGDILSMAFRVADDSPDGTDSLKIFFDTTGNGGDPDTTDRFIQITRNGTLTMRAGVGGNGDGEDWDDYVSEEWQVASDEASPSGWVVEAAVDVPGDLAALSDPFGLMVQVLLTGEGLSNLPESGLTNNASSWQPVENENCEP
jgi:hypothetical protein